MTVGRPVGALVAFCTGDAVGAADGLWVVRNVGRIVGGASVAVGVTVGVAVGSGNATLCVGAWVGVPVGGLVDESLSEGLVGDLVFCDIHGKFRARQKGRSGIENTIIIQIVVIPIRQRYSQSPASSDWQKSQWKLKIVSTLGSRFLSESTGLN